jgi:hypothetical protein
MDFTQTEFRKVLRSKAVQNCLTKTVAALISRWRTYESVQNYRARCLYAVWHLLVRKESFSSDGELLYYLFGNQHKKNLVYWHVENQLRKDSGIKSFDGPKHVELDSFNGTSSQDHVDREQIIQRLSDVFSKSILTEKEKAILVLSFNLSLMENEREDSDIAPWSTEEIAVMIGLTEKEVQSLRKNALLKLKPHLADLK